MKNSIKTGLLALFIALSASACTGNASKSAPDTAKVDSQVIDTGAAGQVPGANGSGAPIDSGLDKSGSGGTDTTRKP